MAFLKAFCPTDIGAFRQASHHERSRPSGAAQTIFIRCTAGVGWCDVAGMRHTVHQGNLLIIPAHCSHAYGSSDNDPWSIEWFHAIGDGVADYLRWLGLRPQSPVLALRSGVWDSPLFEEALTTLEKGFTDAHLLHAASALGHLLSRIIVRQNQGIEDYSSVSARIERATTALQENHAQPLCVPELAAQSGFSTSHFASLFHRHTGHPPMDFLIRARVGQACQLLDLTTLSIKEIAASVGYSDPYYFSRIFKKITSSSPKTYRDTHRG